MDGTLLYQLIERIGNLLRAEERRVGSEGSLQEVHLQALFYLSRCNRYSNTPAGVTDYLGATKGTVSQTLQVLEKKGYITKERDQKDRRVLHLDLTLKGKRFLNQVVPPPLFSDALKTISPDRLRSLEGQLTNLLVALQRANQSRSFGVCQTCRYFLKEEGSFRCGLTHEPLEETEISKICREHEQRF